MLSELDAFISYSSKNRTLASKMEKALESKGFKVWLDDSDIKRGFLLRKELHTMIQQSHVLLLLWSQYAQTSRWVATEILTAYHLDKFIIPCTLDDATLPRFLTKSISLNIKKINKKIIEDIYKTIKNSPARRNELQPLMISRNSQLQETIQQADKMQHLAMTKLENRDLLSAQTIHDETEKLMQQAEKTWRNDLMILNLAGYHRKNAYMLKHWDAIQAGVPPKDPLLADAEQFFFKVLFINPVEPSALNGIGSVMTLEGELDAAEFFQKIAIQYGEKDGKRFDAARHDLEMINYFRKKAQ